MTLATIIKFQFGDRLAIESVARSRCALLVGACLVLITSVPRNYDQLAISEQTLRWILGPLVFSMVSGTFVFFFTYWLRTTVKSRKGEIERTQGIFSSWVGFMGLFWMTAPIAWVYAIPIERMIESPLLQAKLNVALLAVVALWRVLLLPRVLEVVCRWDFGKALSWVFAVASAEVLALVFFSPFLAANMFAGMGGMRNSPAEEFLVAALMLTGMGAMGVFPIALVLGFFGPWKRSGVALPLRGTDRFPAALLAGLAVIWVVIAIYPQKELRLNVRLEALVEKGSYREAIEMMNGLQPEDFSPSRELPPKEFEVEIFEQGEGLINVMQAGDVEWVQRHALSRLERILRHVIGGRGSAGLDAQLAERESGHYYGKRCWTRVDWELVLAGLRRTELGMEWLDRHPSLVPRLKAEAQREAERESKVDPS